MTGGALDADRDLADFRSGSCHGRVQFEIGRTGRYNDIPGSGRLHRSASHAYHRGIAGADAGGGC